MTGGIDVFAAVVGITAFFTHLLNKLRKLVLMSQSVLKMLFDSSDFHKHFQYLATNHRAKLISRHGKGSREVDFLDKCTATCKDTYDKLQMRLQRVHDSKFKVYRAYREKDDIEELAKLMQKSNADLAMVVAMTSSSGESSNEVVPYTKANISTPHGSGVTVRGFGHRRLPPPPLHDFSRSRFDDEVRAKVSLFETLLARLESEGKDVSAGYSCYDVAYEVDAYGEYVTRLEAKIDIQPIGSDADYYVRQSVRKETYKPLGNGVAIEEEAYMISDASVKEGNMTKPVNKVGPPHLITPIPEKTSWSTYGARLFLISAVVVGGYMLRA